jgi:hypothetical protein
VVEATVAAFSVITGPNGRRPVSLWLRLDSGEAMSELTWAIRGAGLDYDLHAVGTEPPTTTTESDVSWYYDSPEGDFRLTYLNHMHPPSTAVVTADFTRVALLQGLLASPYVIPGVRFPYLRGDWTLELQHLE